MQERSMKQQVREHLGRFPAVAILGARQVGKTTLAQELAEERSEAHVYLDLEAPDDVGKLRDPMTFLSSVKDRLVVIDEVQRMPELFPMLRSLIDRDRRKGRFLLLGSSSNAIIQQASESLAGRIAYLDLFPFMLREVGDEQQNKLWLRGGFPEAFLARNNEEAFSWMTHYARNVIERDLSLLGFNAPPKSLRALLQMLTSVHGQQLNMSMLAKSLGLSVTTIKRYLDHFEQAYLTFSLPSFHTNTRKRLTRAPKLYLLDSGMLHALSGIHSMDELRGHVLLGNSWEGFVVQQVRAWIDDPARVHYFRTLDGSELDLVITRGTKAVAAIEIKTTNAPTLSKGNRLAFEAVGAKKQLILTPSADDHPYGEGITVCSMKTLWKHLEGV
jgi:predicted AAA+ superfamily ATPase